MDKKKCFMTEANTVCPKTENFFQIVCLRKQALDRLMDKTKIIITEANTVCPKTEDFFQTVCLQRYAVFKKKKLF